MCWKSINKPKLQTAKEPIVVYKVVFVKNERIESCFQKFHYELGHKYKISELKLLFSIPALVGLACYKVFEGFHSYNNYNIIHLQPLVDFPHIKIAKCIIPKGSKYYRNKKQTVSNAIIISEIL